MLPFNAVDLPCAALSWEGSSFEVPNLFLAARLIIKDTLRCANIGGPWVDQLQPAPEACGTPVRSHGEERKQARRAARTLNLSVLFLAFHNRAGTQSQ